MKDQQFPPPLRGVDRNSFTYYSIVTRLPDIARRTLAENDFSPPVVAALEALIAEIPNGRICPIIDPEAPDIAAWNEWTAVYATDNWLTVPWFFAETYFYRRIVAHTGWFQNGRDPFAYQKQKGLTVSRPAIQALARSLTDATLPYLLGISLWGNQADLSLWPADGDEQPTHEHTEEQAAHLLVDDRSVLEAFLADQPYTRLDILLDNAGFEFVADLALADYWLRQSETAVVHLHAKCHPTFVSDVILQDWEITHHFLKNDPETAVQTLAHRLEQHQKNGRLHIHTHSYWTSPLPAWEMPPSLRQELAQAQLVISKGDANYRRLLGDRHWPFTTPFPDATAYFPAPLLTLRTAKSEVAVGLTTSQITHLNQKDPHWLTNGRWGFIQFRP
ncbi:MAG: protein-glutamate O-methyltransferase family protein [Chloroflexi bacterium]|nr:MAG: protein-glutamate O-methyltransferase family protein [Chloroflexota bacterium]